MVTTTLTPAANLAKDQYPMCSKRPWTWVIRLTENSQALLNMSHSPHARISPELAQFLAKPYRIHLDAALRGYLKGTRDWNLNLKEMSPAPLDFRIQIGEAGTTASRQGHIHSEWEMERSHGTQGTKHQIHCLQSHRSTWLCARLQRRCLAYGNSK